MAEYFLTSDEFWPVYSFQQPDKATAWHKGPYELDEGLVREYEQAVAKIEEINKLIEAMDR